MIDSSLDLCLAVNSAMRSVGAPVLAHELIAQFIGDGAAMLVRRALSASDSSYGSAELGSDDARFEQAFAHFLDFYHHHKLDNTKPYEGVLPSLRALRSQHLLLPMAVLTNKPVRPSRDICHALGLGEFFFANYGGNSFTTKKPDPAGLLQLMQEARKLWRVQAGIESEALLPRGVVMIGDSDVDVLTARRAGATSLGCRYGLATFALDQAKPDLTCNSPQEWPALLAPRQGFQDWVAGQSQAAPRTPLESPC